jgi:CMP-N,N'-diacetyllegionaminic acid synthase
MKLLGIITARGGSKGIPRKNIKPLAGKPLMAYTIEAAKGSGIFDRIVVSTEDQEIADVAKKYGAEVLMRPQELAQDTTPTLPVLTHVVTELKNQGYEPDAVAILQPTSPLRTPEHVREAAQLFKSSKADCVMSVNLVPADYNPHWQFTVAPDGTASIYTGESFANIIRRRQELEQTYTRNGALYIFKTELLFKDTPTFYGSTVRAYVMDPSVSVNINTPEEFDLAEKLLLSQSTNNSNVSNGRSGKVSP